MLVHGEGDYLGQPFKLEDWQREFIYRLYEYDPETLRRIVRRAGRFAVRVWAMRIVEADPEEEGPVLRAPREER